VTKPSITGVELAGGPGLPLLVVGPSLGTSPQTLWSACAERLGKDFHVVGWSLPGHAGAPVGDPFTMAELAVGVLDWVTGVSRARGDDHPRFGYAGDSVGGAVGLQLLLDSPEVVTGAVLLCTGAKIGEAAGWHERAAAVRASGAASMVSGSAQRWFGPGFMDREPAVASELLDVLHQTDAEGYAQVCEALADFDVRPRLGSIGTPVLAIAGADDGPAPPEGLALIAALVPGSRLVVLDGVAHLAPAESPDRVAELIGAHFDGPTDAGYTAGIAVRREVLGDAHVDRATAAATDLTRDFQEFITRYAWGGVWTRPGLDRRSRSMITLTALIARGHHEELAMHLRAALRNGLSRDEIREVILQSAIYCGVPDANTAFRIAQEVLGD